MMFTESPAWRIADLRLNRDIRMDSMIRAGMSTEEINRRLAPLDQEIAELEAQL